MSILSLAHHAALVEPHIASRPGIGAGASIRQLTSVDLKRLYIEEPILIVVAQGEKTVRWNGGECRVLPGQAVAVAGGQSVDITNCLGHSAHYCAYWMVWHHSLIGEQAARVPELAPVRGAQFIPTLDPRVLDAFTRTLASIGDPTVPAEICRHRLQEMLIWLGMLGLRFDEREFSSLGTRLRMLLNQNIGRAWTAPEVARELATSEATLRRKLAQEGASFSDILLDTQMSYALRMLQSSQQPITEIALACGFQTPSHFSARFRQRFGFAPSAIRARKPAPEGEALAL